MIVQMLFNLPATKMTRHHLSEEALVSKVFNQM
jgi:hypothetical protein